MVGAQDSCAVRVSLLTCAPGAELYASFGHTAIRVQDAATGTDKVYNYGTFEFSPSFYMEFVRGKLLYYLSVEPLDDFLWQYQLDSRSVIEQDLNLTCTERQQLLAALERNALPQNRYYLYDFITDNCTTRAGDMVVAEADSAVVFGDVLQSWSPTYRDLIHTYLDSGHQYWSKLGIDLLLGARVDQKAGNRGAMFLPDYLMLGFDKAATGGRPLVSQKRILLAMPSALPADTVFTPLFFFTLALLVFGWFTWRYQHHPGALRVADFVFFTLLGLIGMVILFMWWGTDHRWTPDNFNLLWALPTHLVGAFLLLRKAAPARKYFSVVLVLNLLLLAAWFFLQQEMNAAFLPILFLSALRSWHQSAYHGRKKTQLSR